MSHPSNELTCEKLVSHINNDIKVCEKLLTLLKNEREYLKKRNFDELDKLIEDKAKALKHLENSANSRTNILTQYASNLSDNEEVRWQKLIEKFNSHDLLQSWVRLKQLIVDCKSENEINGKLMTRNEHTFNRLLDILRGQEKGPELYTGKGSKSGNGAKHQLGSA